MFEILPLVILIASGLVILSVLTSVIAFRIGAPLLLLFLALGLAVGEDGLGIQFDDARVAYFIGSIALAVILFDSGFNTRFETISRSWGPALVLSTVGVLLTTALVGAATHYLSGLSWLASLLLGAIVSSTDAAAVFFLLRVGGLKIRERVRATLEVESGSNDPMAVFLTIALVELIVAGANREAAVIELALAFVSQIGIGAVAGFAGGWAITKIVNRLTLEPGLYPVMMLGLALFLFALTSLIGGSGFLAVYIAGILAGNMGRRAMPLLRRFQDGLTWMCQIAMFLMLGLLASPSAFGQIVVQAIFVALFLIFIARPVAVWLCLLPFGFTREETAFISWVGLRGAVSILLAIVPMMAQIPVGQAFFNIAFIIVLTSLLVQGWTISPMARWLGLVVPPAIGPVEKLELELPGNAHHELVVYRIVEDSPVAAGERIPRWARPSLILRGGRSMRLHEAGKLRPGDYVYIFAAPRFTPLLDRLFASPVELTESDTEFFGDFSFPAGSKLGDLAQQYDIEIDEERREKTIADILAADIGSDIHRGDRMTLGKVELIVRDVNDDGKVVTVGLSLAPQETGRRRLPLFQNLAEIRSTIRKRFRERRESKADGKSGAPEAATAVAGDGASSTPVAAAQGTSAEDTPTPAMSAEVEEVRPARSRSRSKDGNGAQAPSPEKT